MQTHNALMLIEIFNQLANTNTVQIEWILKEEWNKQKVTSTFILSNYVHIGTLSNIINNGKITKVTAL